MGREWQVSWPGDIDSDATFCCHHPNWQAGPRRPKLRRPQNPRKRNKSVACAAGQATQIPVDDRACGLKLISISDYRRRDQANISPLIPMHDASCGVHCLDHSLRSVARMTITREPTDHHIIQLWPADHLCASAVRQNKHSNTRHAFDTKKLINVCLDH